MKNLLITTLATLVLAAFATTVLAGDCSECEKDSPKDKAKTEQPADS